MRRINIVGIAGSGKSHDSILLWFFRSCFKNRRQYGNLQSSPKYAHPQIIRLRSPRESQEFLSAVGPAGDANDLLS